VIARNLFPLPFRYLPRWHPDRSGKLIEPYDIQLAEGSTDLPCMADDCHESVQDFEALVLHIYKHSVKNEMSCILCPTDRPTQYGRDVLFFKINKPNVPTLCHIRRHLPPQIPCPDCTAVFYWKLLLVEANNESAIISTLDSLSSNKTDQHRRSAEEGCENILKWHSLLETSMFHKLPI
jgi:hypothetical protein